MKTILYLVRHGESTANAQNLLCGQTDFPLSEKGLAQAKLTGEYLKDFHLDAIYASPLSRAYQTGEAIHAFHPGIPLVRDDGLKEINCGAWEGKTYAYIQEHYPQEYRVWKENIGLSRRPGGESVEEVQTRIVRRIREICEENAGKTVCLAFHAMVIRSFCTFVYDVPLERMQEVPWVSNASVTTVEYEDGVFTITDFDHNEHQGALVTSLNWS